jgi:tRNA(Ile)-lysidine synthase
MTTRSELPAAGAFLRRLTGGQPRTDAGFLAAVSGGLDSMCLLCFLTAWCGAHGGTVTAAHFNHRLRAEADRDEAFVRDFCAARGIPFVRGEGDTLALAERDGLTVEEAARRLRYDFLDRAARETGCHWIFTAHHADDNAETVLLNLIRGSGSRGLRGIPAVRGNIARPFLELSRAELAAYAAAHHLPHVEDETNGDPAAAARNLLRLRVMPALREVNPRAVENIGRTAAILAREDEALDRWAAALTAAARETDGGVRMPGGTLAAAPDAVAHRAALDLLERACGHRRDLTAADAAAVVDLARGTRRDLEVRLSYGIVVRREGGDLVLACLPPETPPVSIAIGETAAFGDWTVSIAKTPGAGETYPLTLPAGAALTVTRWQPRDRMTLPGARGPRSLKRLCADRGIRPWQRDSLPVLRVGDAPAAVPGVGVDLRFAPSQETVFVTYFQQTEEKKHGQ